MRTWRWCLIGIWLLALTAQAETLEPVRLQLMWKHQFQFAGYYMALEKGYYQSAGLDVELVESDGTRLPVDEVMSGRAQFGIGRSSLLLDRLQGADVVALLAAYQYSPLMLLTTAASGIDTPEQLRGKRVMVTEDAVQVAEIMAMLLKFDITAADVQVQPQSFNILDLVEGRTDAVASYTSNEPYQLEQLNVGYHIIHPQQYGFPMYSDILFTSGALVDTRYQMVRDFMEASRQGWLYAFEHVDETVDLILSRYNTQQRTREGLLFEAQALRALAFDERGAFGTLSEERFEAMASVYRITRAIEPGASLDGFLFCCAAGIPFELSPEQRHFLRTLGPVRVCVNRDWLPLQLVERGRYTGMLADYQAQVFGRLGLEAQMLGTGSWQEARTWLESGRCDLIAGIMPTRARDPLHFSRPFFTAPMLAVVREEESISHPARLQQPVGVLAAHDLDILLLRRYPGLKVMRLESIETGLRMVQAGQLSAFVDTQASLSRILREFPLNGLRLDAGLNDSWDLGFAAPEGQGTLIALLDRAIADLSPAEREQIQARWLPLEPAAGIDPELVRNLLLALAGLFILLGYRFYLVSSTNRRLARIAREDPLTGIDNRHALSEQIEQAIELAQRSGIPLALIYLDVDDFKTVNDRYGHAEGDQVLVSVTQTVATHIRRTDRFGRWGGEEFLVLLQDTDLEGGAELAEKLRGEIEARVSVSGVPVRCSFGVAQWCIGESSDQLIHRADTALYRAKKGGKNRVERGVDQIFVQSS